MNNPLDALKHWFLALAPTEQNNLGALIDHFASCTSKGSGEQHQYPFWFLTQLDAVNFKPKENLQKTLFYSKIVDFTIETFANEEAWQTRMETLLDTHNEYTKKGMPEISLEMLDQFNELKESWIAISESWLDITTGKLSNESINKWYLHELLKEVRR